MRCSDKRRYETRHEAKVRAAQVHKHGNPKPRVYRCPECDCFHLTTANADSRAFFRRGERSP